MSRCWLPVGERWTFAPLAASITEQLAVQVDANGSPRDIGAVLNSELSDSVRRMSVLASVSAGKAAGVAPTGAAAAAAAVAKRRASAAGKKTSVHEEISLEMTEDATRVSLRRPSPLKVAAAASCSILIHTTKE